MQFFEPTKLPGTADLASPIADVSVGAYHLAVRTQNGQLYTFGTGPVLALPRSFRKAWELCEVTDPAVPDSELAGENVLSMHCGPYTTAMIVEV